MAGKLEERILLLEDRERRKEEDIAAIKADMKDVKVLLTSLDKSINNHISHISWTQIGMSVLQLLTLMTVLADFWKFIIR